ncbi:type 1 fimbrial protein [Stenotrophomonas maltophilia]|uniref:fimbrial protein n=1 Tax=Stenotrophomonas maltophilia TaxID=40324 RepID=UPI0015DE4FA7|nr:fimbrial protein [Stenotrophomonas maltophilia]MBA0386494.1 type 1 fimbrial protein [Stenotrophomonas maltophilia]MBA0391882.1 type 1 fimbrial protein [Stenotrophomonas maltophilia]MBA0464326.1 type 1 fimbrial protein [Stenotrophomonas maltophilia]MBA0471704.1 type 1 fimbrial protein [Stenotrophomonas maltophilia]
MNRPPSIAALIAVALLAVPSVCAQSIDFAMTGEILPPTCAWAVGDGQHNVQLNAIELRDLPASGAAGQTPFQLRLENCSPGVTQVSFSFSGNGDPDDPYRYLNLGNAPGIAIELQSADGRTLRADGSDSARTVPVTSNRAELDLSVAYWRLGTRPAGSGTVIAVTQVVLIYP